jgi:hypothetical protein
VFACSVGNTSAIHKLPASLLREVLYIILVEFGVSVKLVMLVETCLNKTCSKIHIGRRISDTFLVHCSLKQGDALSPLLFRFTLEYAIMKTPEIRAELKLVGKHQRLVHVDDVGLLGVT